jgi:Recombinase zinc beta ribbon domain
LIDANAHMKPRTPAKAGRGGRALLAGLLRCRRCGRMLEVNYAGAQGKVLRYRCRSCPPENPDCPSVTFGGVKADELVVQQVLRAVSGNAIAAALRAAQRERQRQGDQRRSLEMGLAQARYQAQLAERRYEAVDPDQRLVAGELEARWNLALDKVRAAEAQCAEFEQRLAATAIPSRASLFSLAQDLPAVWQSSTDMRLKQRIVRLVLREIVADVDPARREVTLVLHWAGGRHSQVRWTKNRVGWQGRSKLTAEAAIGKMAGEFSDHDMALTLNRQRLRTATGAGWTAKSVARVREQQHIPEFHKDESGTPTLNLLQASGRLQVSTGVILKLVRQGILPGRQVVGCAPWQIPVEAIDSDAVKEALARTHRRKGSRVFRDDRQQHMFSNT